ncbi:hypothetical protein [Mesorhizobium sp. 1M-11]|uniref:hypothetical protein n=1 Tax=Mesorhizobium sp. 1M-11 TaxID=1529006 RepID=UPI0006C75261|nr:hypothetical protein [Mesorhizobium sp. 1M-11]
MTIFNTEIRGMTFFRGAVSKSGVHRLALAEIYIPELQMMIRGVQLTWTPGKGYGAQSPAALIHGAVYAIGWNLKSAFAVDLAAKMVKMFEAMGGVLPAPKPVSRHDHVTGKPIGSDPFEAAKSGEIERRVFPAEFKIGTVNGRPIAEAVAEANSLIAAMDDGVDDTEGLHRTLGVNPAVSETCDRAGL